MADVKELIRAAESGGPSATDAIKALAERGASALSEIAEAMRESPRVAPGPLAYAMIRELRVITGRDFGCNPCVPLAAQTLTKEEITRRAEAWAASEKASYSEGRLYKYGFAQDLSIL